MYKGRANNIVIYIYLNRIYLQIVRKRRSRREGQEDGSKEALKDTWDVFEVFKTTMKPSATIVNTSIGPKKKNSD